MKKRSLVVGVFCAAMVGLPVMAGCAAEAGEEEAATSGAELDSCFAKVDLSKLTACGGGGGHCYEKALSPLADALTDCPTAGQVCVPDEVLSANGSKLKGCTSVIGSGGCITSALVPQIEKNKASLKQDICAAGQLCVPCTDPTNGNAATPFCKPIGAYKSKDKELNCNSGGGLPKPPPPRAARCCTNKSSGASNGTCLAETAIPEKNRSDTKRDSCSAGEKCVPTAFVENKPVLCDAGIIGKGVCLDKCFDDMLSLASVVLKRDVCTSSEVCIPCAFAPDGTPGCK